MKRNDSCACGSGKKYKKCCYPYPVKRLAIDENLILTRFHGPVKAFKSLKAKRWGTFLKCACGQFGASELKLYQDQNKELWAFCPHERCDEKWRCKKRDTSFLFSS